MVKIFEKCTGGMTFKKFKAKGGSSNSSYNIPSFVSRSVPVPWRLESRSKATSMLGTLGLSPHRPWRSKVRNSMLESQGGIAVVKKARDKLKGTVTQNLHFISRTLLAVERVFGVYCLGRRMNFPQCCCMLPLSKRVAECLAVAEIPS
jgi:hypothetical protein